MPGPQTPEVVRLVVDRTVSIPPPCPDRLEGYIHGPIRLTATEDGLLLQFEVAVETFRPGPYRDEHPERDAVVVFPSGERPGRAAVELAQTASPRGYQIDDVVPWETWGLHGPSGRFHLVFAVFDRQATGAEHEVRVSLHISVSRP